MGQSLSINLHNPRVKKIERLNTGGTICVELSDGPLHGTVDVFLSDQGLADLIHELLKFQTSPEGQVNGHIAPSKEVVFGGLPEDVAEWMGMDT